MTTKIFGTKFSRTPIVRAVDNSHDSITVAWSASIIERPIPAYQFMIRKSALNGAQVNIDEFYPSPITFLHIPTKSIL